MTGRSVPPPLGIRGPITDSRGHGLPEFMRAWDAMWRAIGGKNATVTQEIITRTNESPIPVFCPQTDVTPVPVPAPHTIEQPASVGDAPADVFPVPLI